MEGKFMKNFIQGTFSLNLATSESFSNLNKYRKEHNNEKHS